MCVISMAGSLILIVTVDPHALVIILIVILMFGALRYVYLQASKDIRRLEGIAKSPVFTHLMATFEGITTIRAFEAEDTLKDEFDNLQDYHSGAWYIFLTAKAAYMFYSDIFASIFIGLLTFSLLVFEESIEITGAGVGLVISQATLVTTMIQWSCISSADVGNDLMSFERMLEYKNLPKEPQSGIPRCVPLCWPSKGEIVFENVGLRYHDGGPLLLKQIDLTIKPREKIGIVGRTGAGKSSLISTLFRLTPFEGVIRIDQQNTKHMSLENLRSRISIIPQDPVLFSGTLRYNLDPFEEYGDEELYRALEDVELKDSSNIFNKLENRVMEKGSNYSVGQRQMICLARAILRNNKILVLDEATANVDLQTEASIHATIRKKFADSTVLTIAHRLVNVMDCDKIVVMDAGTIAEFDHPHLLLQNRDGVFHKMLRESGTTTFEQLRNIAADTYKKCFPEPEWL